MDANTTPQRGAMQGAQGFAGGPPPGGRPPGGGGAMMFLGPWGGIVSLVLLAVTYIVLAVVFWRFLKRVGLTPAVAFLMLVPVVNLGVALWAAFAEWPIVGEVARLRLIVASTGGAAAGPVSEEGPVSGPMPGTAAAR